MGSLIARDQYEALEDFVYLNQASLGLIPRRSVKAMSHFLTDVAQHGNIRMSDAAEAQVLDELRAAAARSFDAPEGCIAVIGGASEGLGQITASLATPNAEVVLVPTDFPSVTYPWLAARDRLGLTIRWVEDTPEVDLTSALIDRVVETTTVVCISAVQYATGSSVDIGAVTERAHELGARVIVDVTQLAGAAPVSMREWSADALVCSGYKWLSTHGGVAILAVGEELMAEVPTLVGWKGTDDPFAFDAQTLRLADDARRFELSTMSYCSAVGLTSSLALLSGVGMTVMADHALALATELIQRLEPLGWKPFRELGVGASGHIISLRHPSLAATRVQAALASEHRLIVSARGEGIRVSLHGYNDSSDITRLVEALASGAGA